MFPRRRPGPREMDKGWPLRTTGVVWQVSKTGEFNEWLARTGPKGTMFEQLFTVFCDSNGHCDCCMRCFGQNILFEVDEHIRYRCTDCGHRFYFIPEP